MFEHGLRLLSKSSYARSKQKYRYAKTPVSKKQYSTANHDPQDTKLSEPEKKSLNDEVNHKVVKKRTRFSNIAKYAIPWSEVEKKYEEYLNSLSEAERELQKIINKGGIKTSPEKRFLVQQTQNNSSNNLGGIKLDSETNSSDYIERAKERIHSQLYRTKEELGEKYKKVEDMIANAPFKNEYKEFYGKALTLSGNKLHPIEENKIPDVNVFISLGIDTGDDIKTIIKGLEGFNELLFNLPTPEKLEKFHIYECIIWPSPDRVERYKRGLLYYFDETYVDKYAFEFVDKYLIPQILGKDGQRGYTPPEYFGPILFLGYSLGARDNAIYINAFKHRLVDKLSLTAYEVDAYMRRIFRINIGATVPWDLPSVSYNPYSLNILSLNDMGVLKSQEFFNAVFYNSQIAQQPYSVFHREPHLKNLAMGRELEDSSCSSPREFLITLGIDQISGEYQDSSRKRYLNSLGHTNIHYFKGIKNSPAHKLLTSFGNFFEFFLKDKDKLSTKFLIEHVLKESKPYALLDKNPSIEEITWREKQLAAYIKKQDELKRIIANPASRPPSKTSIFDTFWSFFKNIGSPLNANAKAKDELSNNDPQQKLSK